MPAGLMTVLVALILITPLCGFLFNCGCAWPWAGLADNCNYFDQDTEENCPWCASNWAGAISVGVSVASGYLLSMAEWKSLSFQENNRVEIFFRMLFGLGLFLMIAFGMAWISAQMQNYHYFFSSG